MGRRRKETKIQRKEREERTELAIGLKRGTIIRVNYHKIHSRSVIPSVPEFYRDQLFKCKDCETKEVWTAKSQQRYYEEDKGEIEGRAIRCRACRRKRRHQNREHDRAREKAAAKRKALNTDS